jgi:type IX secretion system PorP/SprF family membrane protein
MRKIIFILLCVSCLNTKAQQDPMFTHYMYNTQWLNPAYAGTRDLMTFTGIYRKQWLNFDGAPTSISFSGHAPLSLGKTGVGINVVNDQIGVTKSTLIAGDYAYMVRINKTAKLSFGLKGLVNVYRNSVSTLSLITQSDAAFANDIQSILPNAGFGMYYFTRNYYFGLSCPRMLQNKLNTSASLLSREQRHYYLIGGYAYEFTRDITFKPTAFLKVTPGAPIEGDLTGTFVFDDNFNVGVMYRSADAVGALIGFNVTDQLYFGYSFDWSFPNTTFRYNKGSHEICLRYDFFVKPETKIKSTRHF